MKTRAQIEQEITRLARTEPGLPDTAEDATLRLLDIALEAGMPLPSDVLGYDPKTGPPGIPLEWQTSDGFLIVMPYPLEESTFYEWHDWTGPPQIDMEAQLTEAELVARFKEWGT